MNPQRSSIRGFTLVEIVITLALMGLLITAALLGTQSLGHARELELPMAKLREFAKRARNLAILEQRPYQVELTPTGVALYSMIAETAATPDFGAAEGMKPRGQVDAYTWEEDVVLTVRRWNQKEFLPAGRQVWIFERSGLCEPLTARVDSEWGYLEMSFNALDAHVEDKTSEIK